MLIDFFFLVLFVFKFPVTGEVQKGGYQSVGNRQHSESRSSLNSTLGTKTIIQFLTWLGQCLCSQQDPSALRIQQQNWDLGKQHSAKNMTVSSPQVYLHFLVWNTKSLMEEMKTGKVPAGFCVIKEIKCDILVN